MFGLSDVICLVFSTSFYCSKTKFAYLFAMKKINRSTDFNQIWSGELGYPIARLGSEDGNIIKMNYRGSDGNKIVKLFLRLRLLMSSFYPQSYARVSI